MSGMLDDARRRPFWRRRLPIQGAVLAVAIAGSLLPGAVRQPPVAAATASLSPQPVAGEITSTMGSGTGCVENENGVDAASNPIILDACNHIIGQQIWVTEPDDSIRVYFSYHSSAASTGNMWCLLVTGNDAVVTYNCNGTEAEQWLPWNGSSTQLQSVLDPTMCLSSASGGQGSQLLVAKCSSSSYQQWSLPASTPVSQELSAVLNLQSSFNPSTDPVSDAGAGLFVDNGNECTTNSGNCWWWSANALYSIIDFADQAGGGWNVQHSGPDGLIDLTASDIQDTYQAICYQGTGVNQCPTNPLSSTNENKPNTFQNGWFDDTGNWALTWLNAYEYEKSRYGTCANVPTGQPCFDRYKYLAENLWYYITHNGWDSNDNATSGWPFYNSCTEPWSTVHNAGGLFQKIGVNSSDDFKNLGTNSLYLRLSSWLYIATGNSLYFDGEPGNSGTYGGVVQEANWLIGTGPGANGQSPLVQEYSGSTFPDYPLFLNGEVQPATANSTPLTDCEASPGQKQTQHEGMVIGALAELYQAAQLDDTGLVSPPSFYLTVADNIAKTAFNDTINPVGTYPEGLYSNPAMIDNNSIFSETCDPDTPGSWPDTCDVLPEKGSDGDGASENVNPAWLPGKGIFIRNLYCLNDAPVQTLQASDIATFVQANAQSVWGSDQNLSGGSDNLNMFGFLWDSDDFGFSWAHRGDELNFATQLSAMEAMTANIGVSASTPLYTMC